MGKQDAGADSEEEDALEAKIADKHDEFLREQAEKQEQRAAAGWSAPPPLPSPGMTSQRKHDEEAQELATQDPEAKPREEFQPPERPAFVANGHTSTSYLGPQPSGAHACMHMAPRRPMLDPQLARAVQHADACAPAWLRTGTLSRQETIEEDDGESGEFCEDVKGAALVAHPD
jgi:hypothetical protein